MDAKIVFSDVDGTLLSSDHRVLEGSLYAIHNLQERGIPFVIISARSPSGIYPIMNRYNFTCPIICYSGALILDEKKKVLYTTGIEKEVAHDVISFIEKEKFDCSWNLYSMDQWIVKNKKDPRVLQEEGIVNAKAEEGTIDLLPEGVQIGKILGMCNPKYILEIEQALKANFPMLSIARSSDTLLEIMANGITKRSAMKRLCNLWGISIEKTIAFGDHYNDVEMLETAGISFLMGNAPNELKGRFQNITDSNDAEGIYKALVQIGMVPPKS